MNTNYKIVLFLLVGIFSCSTQRNAPTNGEHILDICDLPFHKDKKVRLIASYSGIEEYWSLSSVARKKCSNVSGVDLDFDSKYDLPDKFQNIMAKAHNSYWNSFIIIDAIGVYETGNKFGYGHLGHNQSRFKVVEVIDMKLIKKK